MKNLKTFKQMNENDNLDLDKQWEDIQLGLDVYQLFELLMFVFSKEQLPDTVENIEAEESDYNPDHLYEPIRYELEQKGLFVDFVTNWEELQIKMQEADPFHWRHRNKLMDDLSGDW